MARAALGWTLDDLARETNISRRTILKFEAGETILRANIQKLRSAMEAEGVIFVDRGQHRGGVVPPVEGR